MEGEGKPTPSSPGFAVVIKNGTGEKVQFQMPLINMEHFMGEKIPVEEKKMKYINTQAGRKSIFHVTAGKKEAEECLNIGSILISTLHYIKLSLYSSLIYSKC